MLLIIEERKGIYLIRRLFHRLFLHKQLAAFCFSALLGRSDLKKKNLHGNGHTLLENLTARRLVVALNTSEGGAGRMGLKKPGKQNVTPIKLLANQTIT